MDHPVAKGRGVTEMSSARVFQVLGVSLHARLTYNEEHNKQLNNEKEHRKNKMREIMKVIWRESEEKSMRRKRA